MSAVWFGHNFSWLFRLCFMISLFNHVSYVLAWLPTDSRVTVDLVGYCAPSYFCKKYSEMEKLILCFKVIQFFCRQHLGWTFIFIIQNKHHIFIRLCFSSFYSQYTLASLVGTQSKNIWMARSINEVFNACLYLSEESCAAKVRVPEDEIIIKV